MNENDFAQTSCIARKGDEPLTFSWSFHGGDITHDLGIYITPVGSRGSMLVIPDVGHKHGGNYTCTVKNAAGSRAQTIELRVNGNNTVIRSFKEGKHKSFSFLEGTPKCVTIFSVNKSCYIFSISSIFTNIFMGGQTQVTACSIKHQLVSTHVHMSRH